MKSKNSVRTILLIVIFSLLVALDPASAERVIKVTDDGHIELDRGGRVLLAGIVLAPEAIRILPVLLSDQDIHIEYESALPAKSDARFAYLYVKNKEMQWAGSKGTSEHQVMLNHLLLLIGAAYVDLDANFRKKEDFMTAEDEARKKGHGIWSYETPPRSVTPPLPPQKTS